MRKATLFFAVFSFFALSFLYAFKKGWLFYFSNQGAINPYSLSENFNLNEKTAIFNNQYLALPSYLAEKKFSAHVLGDTDSPKRIEIDLTNQRLYAYEGINQVFNFLISSGKWGKTPTGVFRIWTKLRYTKMEGGNKALNTYYYLPNVPYTMFFYNDQISKYRGFGIHGTYWHANFGYPMSHGCINMQTEEAALLYYWAKPELPANKESAVSTADNPGTEVIIYGQAPAS
ncbi:MAG: hypothetical protein UU21_C0024G0003 [Candidatus Levybacteria bacterium GW2011_GWA2_40_8]|nr:MAG: hypothetical protein UU21_C0024G0003 [Candidatus Levybacteria bacterium GW2011_GWA2_40_8]